MSCCLYVMLLQVFTDVYISLHIYVLTCVNVPISKGHVTTQNKHYFDILLSTTYHYSLLVPVHY